MINKPLKELCLENEIGKYGIPASAEEFSIDKTRYLRISDIDDFGNLIDSDKKSVSSKDIDKYILKEGDLVFARTGNSTGRTYYHESKNGELAFAGFLIKYGLDPEKVNPKYLKYFTVSKQYKNWVENLSVGSTRGNINAQTFADCPILLPQRKQQKLLVNILSSLDSKIELNNKINKELEVMAKTLYEYWFVQFDFPDENGKPYKSSGGKMVYNQELKREIPEGWEVCRLEDIEDNIITGKTPPKINPEYFNGNIPFITIGDIRGNMHIVSTEETLSKLGADYQSSKYINKGALCVSCIASPGLIGFATRLSQTNQQINSIECRKEENSYYLYFALNDFFNASKAKTGNTFPNMNKGDFSDIKLIKPNEQILLSFGKRIKSSINQIYINSEQNQELAKLRDWLLPMLMNGQVRVNLKD